MNRKVFLSALALNAGLAVGLFLLVVAGSARGEPAAAEPAAVHAEDQEETATWPGAAKMFAAALTLGLTAFATAMSQARIGTAGVGALAENPKLFGNLLIFLVVPETIVILGFVVAALMVF